MRWTASFSRVFYTGWPEEDCACGTQVVDNVPGHTNAVALNINLYIVINLHGPN